MKEESSPQRAAPNCAGRRFALVVARFYPNLAEQLVDGAMRALRECSVAEDDVCRFDAAGCFELPLLCRKVIETKRFDAVVALGVVIRGETPHFDFVAGESARGIMEVQLATGTPIGFGVLTTETLVQAQERTRRGGGDKGYTAALATASLLQELTRLGRM